MNRFIFRQSSETSRRGPPDVPSLFQLKDVVLFYRNQAAPRPVQINDQEDDEGDQQGEQHSGNVRPFSAKAFRIADYGAVHDEYEEEQK